VLTLLCRAAAIIIEGMGRGVKGRKSCFAKVQKQREVLFEDVL